MNSTEFTSSDISSIRKLFLEEEKQQQELELVEERIMVVSTVTDGNNHNKIDQDRRWKILVVQ